MGNDHHHGHGHHGHGHGHHGHGHHGHVHVPTGEGDPRGPLAGALLLNGGYLLVEAGTENTPGAQGTLRDIALALFVGTIVGTYSSIFLAAPLYAQLRENEPEVKKQGGRKKAPRPESGAVR